MSDAPAPTEPQLAPSGVPQIYTSILAISDAMGAIPKLGRGPKTQSEYPFLRVDDVIQKLHYLAIQERVVLVPRVLDRREDVELYARYTMAGDPLKDGKADGIRVRTAVDYEVDFISAIDGSKFTARAFGEAHSNDDKGTRKAETQAYKEILLRVFSITSGEEDPDATDPSEADTGAMVAQDRGGQARQRATRRRGAKADDSATVAESTSPAAAAPDATGTTGSPTAAPEESTPDPEPEEQAAAATDPAAGSAAEPPAEETPRARRIRERREAAARAEQGTPEPEQSPAAPEEAPAEPTKVREQKSNAEQRSDDWKPDPEDIKAAEEIVHEPGSRPVERAADPQTQSDQHAETVTEMRARILGLEADYPDYTRDVLNALGDQMSDGQPRTRWFSNITFLKKLEKAVQQGEWPNDVEKPGF